MRWPNCAVMKDTMKSVLTFALLGAAIGVCVPFVLLGENIECYVLPLRLNVSPFVAVLLQTVAFGIFIGAVTGLAIAFSSGQFASVGCLLAIHIPAMLVARFLVPPYKGKGVDRRMLMAYAVYAVAATTIAVFLACLGRYQMKSSLRPDPPTPPAS